MLLDGLAAIGTIWTFGLMLLICADVIGRSFLNAPITGVAEIAAHSVVGIVFLQIGATIYHRRMTRADFLIQRVLIWAPRFGRGVEALFFLIGALVMFFIAQAAWPGMWNSINLREFFGVQGLFTVPTWPFRGLPNIARTWVDSSGPAARDVLNAYFAAIRAAGQTPGRNWDREVSA